MCQALRAPRDRTYPPARVSGSREARFESGPGYAASRSSGTTRSPGFGRPHQTDDFVRKPAGVAERPGCRSDGGLSSRAQSYLPDLDSLARARALALLGAFPPVPWVAGVAEPRPGKGCMSEAG